MLRASDDAFEVLLSALEADGQDHIAKELRGIDAGGCVIKASWQKPMQVIPHYTQANITALQPMQAIAALLDPI